MKVATLKKQAEIIIAGIVIPVDWDKEQRIVGVAIATADEKEYRVKKTRKGKELFGHLQAYIEATGRLSENKNGDAVLTIKRYSFKRPEHTTP